MLPRRLSRKAERWPMVLLDEVAERGSGHTPSQKHPEYWDGDISWVSLADSWRLDKGLISETTRCITAAGVANSSAVVHPAFTVVLSRDAGVGKSAILGRPMAVSQHFVTWHCGERLSHRFLYHVLQWLKPEFERIAVGSTVQTIGLPYFRKLRVPLPPLKVQEDIAAALDSAERAFHLAAAAVDAMQERTSAVARHLFTQLSAGRTCSIGELFDRVNRRNDSRCQIALTMSGQVGLVLQSDYFARSVSSTDNDHYLLLRRGEFAYNRSASEGRPFGAIKRLTAFDEGIVSTLYLGFALRGGVEADPQFYEEYFDHGGLDSQLRRVANEGSRAHGLLSVAADDFFSLKVPAPRLSDQIQVAVALSTGRRERDLHESLVGVHSKVRRLMAQQLFGQSATQELE